MTIACEALATKAELQELRDQLNEVIGLNEAGEKREVFKAGLPVGNALIQGAATAFFVTQQRAGGSLQNIVLDAPGVKAIWQELADGTASLVGFKGNGTKAPISSLGKVGKVAGSSTAGAAGTAKAAAGSAGATLLLANLVQMGANLALNIATVNVLDERVEAEARGARTQIDAVNSSMIRLYDKHQGDIDKVVQELDKNKERTDQAIHGIELANFDIENVKNKNSKLVEQIQDNKQWIKDLRQQNAQIVSDFESYAIDAEEITLELNNTINTIDVQLNAAELLIQEQQKTIQELETKILSLESRTSELEQQIQRIDLQYIHLRDEFLKLKSELSGDINLVDDRVTLLEGKIAKTQRFVKANQGGGSGTAASTGAAKAQKRILDLANGLAGSPITVPDIQAHEVNNQNSTFDQTFEQLLPQINTGTMTPEQIEDFRQALTLDFEDQLKVAGLVGLGDAVANLDNRLTHEALSRATQDGICKSLNGGSCSATPGVPNPTQGLGGLGKALSGKMDAVNASLNSAALAQNQQILGIVQNTNNVINHETFGLKAVQQFASKAWQATHADKVLNVVSTTMSIHNGMMLSNNLGSTIGEALSVGLQALGIEDHEQNPIDVNSLVRGKVNAMLANLVGAENLASLTARIAKANRIYQAGVNVLDTTRNLFDSAHSVAEIGIEHTGLIGNALRESGVVAENAYGEMIEKVNPQNQALRKVAKFREGFDVVESVVSTVAQVSSDVVEVQDNFEQLKTDKREFHKEIELDKETRRLEREEVKTESQVRTDINLEDFDEAEDET